MLDTLLGIRRWSWKAAVLVSLFCGCKDAPVWIPPAEDDIMPNVVRFYANEDLGMQGTWYWFTDGDDTEFTSIFASDSREADSERWYWYGVTSVRDWRTDDETPAGRVCVKGKLDPDGAAVIGIPLCAPGRDETPFEFPYTLEQCPFKNDALSIPLSRRYVGISFNVTVHVEGSSVASEVKLEQIKVRFVERGRQASAQPYCSVSTVNPSTCQVENVENGLHVEAWIGDTCARAGDDACRAEPRVATNALQAVHLEIRRVDEQGAGVDSSGRNFAFCLTEVAAMTREVEADPIRVSEPEFEAPDIEPLTTPPSELDLDWRLPVPPESWDSAFERFEILRSEVTTEQYAAFINGYPSEAQAEVRPEPWTRCTVHRYLQTDAPDDAIRAQAANCVTWYQADAFCKSVGGVLPSAAEWSYAAKGGDDDATYVWGDDPPSCQYAVMNPDNNDGCDAEQVPAVVCTICDDDHSASDKVCAADEGLCDMAGNLWEWTREDYRAVADGPVEDWMSDYKAIKGGGWSSQESRSSADPDPLMPDAPASLEHPVAPHDPIRMGFRCIRYIDAWPEEPVVDAGAGDEVDAG